MEKLTIAQIKDVVERNFYKTFSKEKRIVFLGAVEKISHLSFIIIETTGYEILSAFRTSSTGIYEVQINGGDSWYLKDFITFQDRICNELKEITIGDDE